MMLSARCPACGRTGRVPKESQGKKVRCAKCGERFVVQANAPSEDEVWFYQELDQVKGPVSWTMLLFLAKQDEIGPETLVRRASNPEWMLAINVSGLEVVSTITETPRADPVVGEAFQRPAVVLELTQPPLSLGRSLRAAWLLAGGVVAAIGLVWAGIAFLANSSAPLKAPEPSRAAEPVAAAAEERRDAEQKALQQVRVEVDALKVQFEQEVAKQAKLREKIQLKNDSRFAEQALERIHSVVAEIRSIDKKFRSILADDDKYVMGQMAEAEIEPTKENLERTTYFKQRNKHIEDAKACLRRGMALARDIQTEARRQIKGNYPHELDEEVEAALEVLNKGFPDIDTSFYYEKVQAIHQDKVEKSEAAEKALRKYDSSLIFPADRQALARVFVSMKECQLAYKKGELTRDDATRFFLPLAFDNRDRHQFDALLNYAGDFRLGHDPTYPSLRETYKRMMLLYEDEK